MIRATYTKEDLQKIDFADTFIIFVIVEVYPQFHIKTLRTFNVSAFTADL